MDAARRLREQGSSVRQRRGAGLRGNCVRSPCSRAPDLPIRWPDRGDRSRARHGVGNAECPGFQEHRARSRQSMGRCLTRFRHCFTPRPAAAWPSRKFRLMSPLDGMRQAGAAVPVFGRKSHVGAGRRNGIIRRRITAEANADGMAARAFGQNQQSAPGRPGASLRLQGTGEPGRRRLFFRQPSAVDVAPRAGKNAGLKNRSALWRMLPILHAPSLSEQGCAFVSSVEPPELLNVYPNSRCVSVRASRSANRLRTRDSAFPPEPALPPGPGLPPSASCRSFSRRWLAARSDCASLSALRASAWRLPPPALRKASAAALAASRCTSAAARAASWPGTAPPPDPDAGVREQIAPLPIPHDSQRTHRSTGGGGIVAVQPQCHENRDAPRFD